MSRENRGAKRVLTEFPLTLFDQKGDVLDRHAVAHDVSDKGFKVEARVELKPQQVVRFKLSLEAEDEVSGRARIVWCQRTDLSYWGGAQFLGLSWGDRKRIRRVTSPDGTNWDAIADVAITSLSVLLATLLAWTGLRSPVWRGVLARMIPEAMAALLMGWALLALLRR